MLFDVRPKNRLEDLLYRQKEVRELKSALQQGNPLVRVTGIRRVGKSSLVLAVLNDLAVPVIRIDARSLYRERQIREADFQAHLQQQMGKAMTTEWFRKWLKSVSEVRIAGSGVSIDWDELPFTALMERLDSHCARTGTYTVLYFDEMQYFRYYGSRGGREILEQMAYIFDNLRNIRMVVTGSEIGMLFGLMKEDDYEMPLYGRYITDIEVRPFRPEESRSFLERGLEEMGVRHDLDLDRVVKRIDGVPGYLVHFGQEYARSGDPEKAYENVLSLMRGMVQAEIAVLERNNPRSVEILRFIADGARSQKEIRLRFEEQGSPIPPSSLSRSLQTLEKMTWITREVTSRRQNRYRVVDPVIAELFRP